MSKIQEIEEYRPFTGKAECHKALNTLSGLLAGIVMDGSINDAERAELEMWYSTNRHLMDRPPFSELLSAIDTALADNLLEMDEVEDIVWLCDRLSSDGYYDFVTAEIQKLHSMLQGILADGEIADIEIHALRYWLDSHDTLIGVYPFDEIYSLLSSILSDGIVTSDERNILTAFFSEFVDTRYSYNLNEMQLQKLREAYSIKGICAWSPKISISNHTFCFTGTSTKATRKEIADIIIAHGGIYNNGVTRRTEFLIVGADGNPCWAFACYGRKIEKAVELRKAGIPIVIVHESDFWSAL